MNIGWRVGLWSKDGRATLESQVRVPPGERVAVSGLIPANESGHVGYAAMTASCAMRLDQRLQAADSACCCSVRFSPSGPQDCTC